MCISQRSLSEKLPLFFRKPTSVGGGKTRHARKGFSETGSFVIYLITLLLNQRRLKLRQAPSDTCVPQHRIVGRVRGFISVFISPYITKQKHGPNFAKYIWFRDNKIYGKNHNITLRMLLAVVIREVCITNIRISCIYSSPYWRGLLASTVSCTVHLNNWITLWYLAVVMQ